MTGPRVVSEEEARRRKLRADLVGAKKARALLKQLLAERADEVKLADEAIAKIQNPTTISKRHANRNVIRLDETIQLLKEQLKDHGGSGEFSWANVTSTNPILLGKGGYGSAYLTMGVNGDTNNIVGRKVIKTVKDLGNTRKYKGEVIEKYIMDLLDVPDPPTAPFAMKLEDYQQDFFRNEYYLSMEYCPYGDLQNLRNLYSSQKLPIPEPFLWYLFKALASSLLFLKTKLASAPETENQIIHRDIKPMNIFLASEDFDSFPLYPKPLLGDFGLARITGTRDPQNPQHVRLGTRIYRAPENADRILSFSPPRSARPELVKVLSPNDVYCVGLVMWILMRTTEDPVAYPPKMPWQFRQPYDKPFPKPHGNSNFRWECVYPTGRYDEPLPHPPLACDYSSQLNGLVKACTRFNPADRMSAETLVQRIDSAMAILGIYEDEGGYEEFPIDDPAESNELMFADPGWDRFALGNQYREPTPPPPTPAPFVFPPPPAGPPRTPAARPPAGTPGTP
ncbi:kinase-like protein [Aulographum hederae CBS 113979]|uniref:non-specific serine/threonine protein kinase n=1 Tax=Aulographum hederae CBS 113979 TaxID=1176131 RepID=A0A6G1GY31_9PEZI|nr:kinase-like protein [Aulographum hederae CBS 113979]